MPGLTKEKFDALVDERLAAAIIPLLKKLGQMPHAEKGLRNLAPGAAPDDEVKGSFLEDREVPKGTSGFHGLRDFLFTIAKSPGDERLVSAAKAMTTGDPEAGGYLVPPEYSARLISLAIEAGHIFPLCQSTPMKSNELRAPVAVSIDESSGELYGGVKFSWVDEGAEKPEKDFKLKEVGLQAHVLAALCKSANQLLEDSSPRIESVIQEAFSKSYAWTLDDVVINGTGAGMPRGSHRGAPCTYTVPKESGQAAGTIVWKNIQKMFARLWPGSKESSLTPLADQ